MPSFAYVSQVSVTRTYACAHALRYLELKFHGGLSFPKLVVHLQGERNNVKVELPVFMDAFIMRESSSPELMGDHIFIVFQLADFEGFLNLFFSFSSSPVYLRNKKRHATTATVTVRNTSKSTNIAIPLEPNIE